MDRKAEILSKVIEIVAKKAGVPVSQIKPETHFINDLNFDSLELVELTMQIEDIFDINVPEEQAQILMTVQRLTDAIAENLSQATTKRD